MMVQYDCREHCADKLLEHQHCKSVTADAACAFVHQTMVQDPDAIFTKLEDDLNEGKPIDVLTPAVREAIVKNIKRRMTPQPLKIRADVELTCYSYDGVLHIQVQPNTCMP